MNQADNIAETALTANGSRMPALFIGHGSPMNAIEDNEFSRTWAEWGRSLPTPKAILCISAHWQTIGTEITAMEKPRTIHDFYGFPQALFDIDYPALGSPVLAEHIRAIMKQTPIKLNDDWGLDHGCWSVLCHLFPDADIPVMQLSMASNRTPEWHYELGKALRWLRNEGVLIIGSGNIVHNLSKLVWNDSALDWALAFEQRIKQLIIQHDHQAIIQYQQLGSYAQLAVPTPEHFLPLLYILGLQEDDEQIEFFNEKTTLGAISMLSLQV